MSNIWTVVIIGIYTLVYVFVFIIQKAKMNKQDAIINSMKAYMDIFDVDELKKYVELKEERISLSYKKILEDDENFKQISKELVNSKFNEIEDYYEKELGEKYRELLAFAVMTTKKQDKKIQRIFVEDFLPKNTSVIEKFVDLD